MQRFTKAMAALMLMMTVICAVECKSKDVSSGVKDSHEYVDLGLPSGTLWATCNIGADKPEDYGYYFAWGETETKDTYNWSNYKYCKDGDEKQLTKYCNQSSYGYNGFTDNLTELQASDDPATASWGNGWCTPSKEQWEELIDNTINTWTTRNGMPGRLFTSKENGKIIFLPIKVYPNISGIDYSVSSFGLYWSRSLDANYPSYAWYLGFYSGSCGMFDSSERSDDFSVRPVREE